MKSLVFVFCLNSFLFVQCIYPPIGDEVQPGSVLLPASRRGRYLANIVRRQAVDGTGIKFNKDADRMNAEAKKKVDVLSEELLPYIIAEQERRTTLYKRVMTAIQNGEKGVTIAEIRNKPPLIIRKGLMFRCPMNRAPKEPDGTGIIMCEDDIEPSPIMFDSCLSAEDRDLYVAENKYFFCNRHKVEGPDLPRNGSTVIGCAPMERTSLNYTSTKCALEDSDDVVVHYRYYPDRTYKFVTELDPDREVCEHWNPCQIGYIYSLPSPDQALPANELWLERQEEVQNDEYIPPIPEDSIYEFVSPTMAGNDYTPIPRRLKPPPGYTFDGVWRIKDPYSSKNNKNRRRQGGNGASAGGSANGGADASGGAHANSGGGNGGPDMRHKLPDSMVEIENNTDGFVTITLHFKFNMGRIGAYYAVFIKVVNGQTMEKSLDLVTIEKATVQINEVKELQITAGQHADPIVLPFKCGKCELLRIMVRADDFNVYNLETTRYKVTDVDGQKEIQIELDTVRPKDVGYFVAVFRGEDAVEEYMQIAKVDSPKQGSV